MAYYFSEVPESHYLEVEKGVTKDIEFVGSVTKAIVSGKLMPSTLPFNLDREEAMSIAPHPMAPHGDEGEGRGWVCMLQGRCIPLSIEALMLPKAREGGQTMCPCVLEETGNILRFTLSVAIHWEVCVGQPLIRLALVRATWSVLVGRDRLAISSRCGPMIAPSPEADALCKALSGGVDDGPSPKGAVLAHGVFKISMLSMLVSLVRMQTGRPGTLHKGWVTLVVEGGHEALAESQAMNFVPVVTLLTWGIEKIDQRGGWPAAGADCIIGIGMRENSLVIDLLLPSGDRAQPSEAVEGLEIPLVA
ncbi:hypothetical protein B0H65DRAFT_439758 [Neurospora tetraspora]|uniref:Uncharacterized protein n=1 Tax=Neurospora tetraspora TaxID=94610 RepID=A0AAE0MV93_9PEZI|nr:hypothetical protein B0H65DRAFT_439758 [Neurospora tetraspora]